MQLQLVVNRVILLVDHANIFHIIQELETRIDYKKLVEVLAPRSECFLIAKIIYMGVYKQIHPKKQAFIAYLQSEGWTVVTIPVKTTPKGKKQQKRIDIRMYKHGVGFVQENMCDTVIIVSGDGDLTELVVSVKELAKKVKVWSFQKSMAQSLKDEAGEENVYYLDTIMDQITITPPHDNENENRKKKSKRKKRN